MIVGAAALRPVKEALGLRFILKGYSQRALRDGKTNWQTVQRVSKV